MALFFSYDSSVASSPAMHTRLVNNLQQITQPELNNYLKEGWKVQEIFNTLGQNLNGPESTNPVRGPINQDKEFTLTLIALTKGKTEIACSTSGKVIECAARTLGYIATAPILAVFTCVGVVCAACGAGVFNDVDASTFNSHPDPHYRAYVVSVGGDAAFNKKQAEVSETLSKGIPKICSLNEEYQKYCLPCEYEEPKTKIYAKAFNWSDDFIIQHQPKASKKHQDEELLIEKSVVQINADTTYAQA